jgi:hypothetical protein
MHPKVQDNGICGAWSEHNLGFAEKICIFDQLKQYLKIKNYERE